MKTSSLLFVLTITAALACNKKTEEQAAASKPSAAISTPSATPVATAVAAVPGAIPAPADVAAPPADAQKTGSGLHSKVLQIGTGTAHPTAQDTVEVHYTGWTKAGSMFDTSANAEPIRFKLSQVIPGWTEGVQLMVEGEKTRFWIPGKLAYGETPTRPGAPAGLLVFDVELIKILSP